MTTVQRPYRIGGFNVCCYHNCTQASAIHAELKKHHIDAAVVDHAFIVSSLQLAVALFRVESTVDFLSVTKNNRPNEGQQQHQHRNEDSDEQSPLLADSPLTTPAAPAALPDRRMSYSRRIFASLSLTHNLDRILQILPPGPHTNSVVILYHSPCAASEVISHVSPAQAHEGATGNLTDNQCCSSNFVERERFIESAIAQAVHATNPAAVEHYFSSISEPFWHSEAVQYAEIPKLMEYYGVSETMIMAAQHSMTRRDVRRVSETVWGQSEETRRRALRWYALELCVITQLAACTA